MPTRQLEDRPGPQDVRFDDVNRLVDDESHAHGGCQMKNEITLAYEPLHDCCVSNRLDGDTEVRIVQKMLNVLHSAC